LSINRLKRASLPFTETSDTTHPPLSEHFSGEELGVIRTGFVKRFKEAFNHRSNAEIARRCKVNEATIKLCVDGERLPTPDTLILIQRQTGISLDWLLTGKGKRLIEPGNLFTEAEEAEIGELAKKHGKSYNEMVHALAMSAAEVSKKF
jgi:transcriptional regulator with XRE-family HTH domain